MGSDSDRCYVRETGVTLTEVFDTEIKDSFSQEGAFKVKDE